jgi:hypothetical protein
MPQETATLIMDAGHLVSMDQPALVNEQMLNFPGLSHFISAADRRTRNLPLPEFPGFEYTTL